MICFAVIANKVTSSVDIPQAATTVVVDVSYARRDGDIATTSAKKYIAKKSHYALRLVYQI
jgi:hypothetical protein